MSPLLASKRDSRHTHPEMHARPSIFSCLGSCISAPIKQQFVRSRNNLVCLKSQTNKTGRIVFPLFLPSLLMSLMSAVLACLSAIKAHLSACTSVTIGSKASSNDDASPTFLKTTVWARTDCPSMLTLLSEIRNCLYIGGAIGNRPAPTATAAAAPSAA